MFYAQLIWIDSNYIHTEVSFVTSKGAIAWAMANLASHCNEGWTGRVLTVDGEVEWES